MLRDINCPVVRSDVTCYWKDMWRRLDGMRRKGQLCDVTLISGDNALFMAHSAVLSASSDMFNVHFLNRICPVNGFKGPNKIVLNDVLGEVLRATLDFIYGITPQSIDDFQRLKVGAEQFGIPGASSYCERHLSETRSVVDWADNSVLASEQSVRAPRVPYSGEGHRYTTVDSQTRDMTNTPGDTENNINGAHFMKCQKFSVESNTSTDSAVTSSTRRQVSASTSASVPNETVVNSELSSLISVQAITTADIVSRRCRGMTPPSDVVHNAMMTRMSITDLARPIECPHLKKMLGDGFNETYDFELSNTVDSENPDALTIDTDSDAEGDSLTVVSNLEEKPSSRGTKSPSLSVNTIKFDGTRQTFGDEKNGSDRFPFSTSKVLQENEELGRYSRVYASNNVINVNGIPAVSGYIKNCSFSLVQSISKATVEVPSVSGHSLYSISTMSSPNSALTYNNSSDSLITVQSSGTDRLHENRSYFLHPSVDIPLVPTTQNGSYTPVSDMERFDPYERSKLVTSVSPRKPQDRSNVSTNQDWPLLSNHVMISNHSNTNVANNCSQVDSDRTTLSHNNPNKFTSTHNDSHCDSNMSERSVGVKTVNAWSPCVSSTAYEQLPVDELNENVQTMSAYCQSSNQSTRMTSTEVANTTESFDAINSAVNSLPSTVTKTTALVSKQLMCSECPLIFPTVHKLQVHELRAHSKGKLFTCDKCNFRSPRKKDVQAHMLSQHNYAPPGVRVFTCTVCAYKCIDKNRFQEHEAMHTGLTVHKCPLCSKGYTTRRGMRTHLKYHSADRPHRCDQCSATFKVRSKLVDHIKLLHEQKGVKPYKCRYCSHTSALRGNCNQHIRKYHVGQSIDVIDMLAEQRRGVKDYDYAGLEGEGIAETKDIGTFRRCSDE